MKLRARLPLAPVAQRLDSAIHWINHYPLDNSIGFASVYPLDSDLSGGQRYPSFEQLGPELYDTKSYYQFIVSITKCEKLFNLMVQKGLSKSKENISKRKS